MTKAEPVEHEGYALPNWLTKCKDVLAQARVLGIVALGLLVLAGLAYWNHDRPAYSDTTHTQPSSTILPVRQSGLTLPAPAHTMSPAQAPDGSTEAISPSGVTSSVSTAASTTPIGPAPTNSLQSLQPSEGNSSAASNSPAVQSLTGSVTQTTQAAGNAPNQLLQGLGL